MNFLNVFSRTQYHVCIVQPLATLSHWKKYFSHLTTFHIQHFIYIMINRKRRHTHVISDQVLINFQNSFTNTLSRKFAIEYQPMTPSGHHTLTTLLHYLVKCQSPKITLPGMRKISIQMQSDTSSISYKATKKETLDRSRWQKTSYHHCHKPDIWYLW